MEKSVVCCFLSLVLFSAFVLYHSKVFLVATFSVCVSVFCLTLYALLVDVVYVLVVCIIGKLVKEFSTCWVF